MIDINVLAAVWSLSCLVWLIGWCSTDITPKWIEYLWVFVWTAPLFIIICAIVQILCNRLVITFTWH